MKWYPAAAAYWAEMVASAVGLLSTGRLFFFFFYFFVLDFLIDFQSILGNGFKSGTVFY
jgi:hypothetical protein